MGMVVIVLVVLIIVLLVVFIVLVVLVVTDHGRWAKVRSQAGDFDQIGETAAGVELQLWVDLTGRWGKKIGFLVWRLLRHVNNHAFNTCIDSPSPSHGSMGFDVRPSSSNFSSQLLYLIDD